MIKVTLEIDNKMAHGCSPIQYLEKFILFEAKQCDPELGMITTYDTPYARINVKAITQI